MQGERAATVLLDEEWNEFGASLSPDGRWLAYTSNETGQREVYVRPFPDVESGRWQISTDGGQWPMWNPSDDEVFYRGRRGMMALRFDTEPTFTPGTLTQLFEWEFSTQGRTRRMAVAPDGQRFLLLAGGRDEDRTPQITVVSNWFEELKARVPIP